MNGSETLSTIDQSLRQLRRDLRDVDAQLQTASQQISQLQSTTVERFRALAKFRLDRLLGDRVGGALDEVDARVSALLAARERELVDLEQDVGENEQLSEQRETERKEQRQRVNEAAQELDAAQAKTQERLHADPGFCGRLEKAQRADAVAREAEAKTRQAEEDRASKGAPYESDPLFMYLWNRGYGTAAYSAGPLARLLDGWVARLCRYHDARPNYDMLLEIPKRLREHAGRVRQRAEELLAPVREEEQAAAERDGIPRLAEALHDKQQALAALDARIQEGERTHRLLTERRAAFAVGKDESFQKCLDSMAFQLEREPLLTLRRHAAATTSPADDAMVQQLSEFNDQKAQLTESLGRYEHVYNRHLGRVEELENVRRRFKQHDYDDYGSDFANGSVIVAILNEFLRGLATPDELWTVLRRNHRRRPPQSNPTFGGGFGLPTSGSWRIQIPSNGPWYGPSGGGGGGVFSGGGGGGGGFGGGGFRTTGGF